MRLRLIRNKKLLFALVLAAAAASTAAGVLAAVGSAPHPPPGVSAGVSSLDRLPAVATLPPRVAHFVDVAAGARGMDPEQAKIRVRELRTNLGTTGADVYAFESSRGAACFILTGQVGICPASASDGSPGLQWTIGGGYPGRPSNLAGIASDDVTRIQLRVDGRDVPTSLQNNVVFAEYPQSAKLARITIHRRDGSQSSVDVQLEPTNVAAFRDLHLLRAKSVARATQP
jgi:hypothetical protein